MGSSEQALTAPMAGGSRRALGSRGFAERVVDLPGRSMQLRADSTAGRPSLIPNLTLALVLGLSIALFGVVILEPGVAGHRSPALRKSGA